MTGANSENSECDKGNASTNNEDGDEGGNNGTYTDDSGANDSKHSDSNHSDGDNNGSGLGMEGKTQPLEESIHQLKAPQKLIPSASAQGPAHYTLAVTDCNVCLT